MNSRLTRFNKYRLFWIFTLGILLFDQATKWWINGVIPFGTYHPMGGPGGASPVVLVPNFIQLVHIGNEGAAWGIFSGYRIFLVLIAVIALVVIYLCRGHLELKRPAMQVAFGLITGGILGNLFDRVLFGHVVDFLDFTLPGIPVFGLDPYRWPAFNVADAGITCGVFFYLLLSFFSKPSADTATAGPGFSGEREK